MYWLTNNNEKNEKKNLKRCKGYDKRCNLLTTDCVTTATVAKRLGMTPKQLYGRLKERGVLYKSDGMWMLIPKYTGLGLLRYRYSLYYTLLGEKKVRVYPVWTEKGLKFLTEEFQDV